MKFTRELLKEYGSQNDKVEMDDEMSTEDDYDFDMTDGQADAEKCECCGQDLASTDDEISGDLGDLESDGMDDLESEEQF